jgi:hypothetical protein
MAQPIKSTLPEQPAGASPASTATRRAPEPTSSARVLEIRPRERERADIRRSLDVISTRASEAFGQIGMSLSDSYRWAAQQTRQSLQRARIRTQHVCNEYPLHVIAAVAGTAFIVGALLRLARSSHDTN